MINVLISNIYFCKIVDLRICPLPFKNTKILRCCILGALHVKFHGKILNKFQDLKPFHLCPVHSILQQQFFMFNEFFTTSTLKCLVTRVSIQFFTMSQAHDTLYLFKIWSKIQAYLKRDQTRCKDVRTIYTYNSHLKELVIDLIF